MQKWEYRIESPDEKILNILGSEGWEVVTVIVSGGGPMTTHSSLVLKRPLGFSVSSGVINEISSQNEIADATSSVLYSVILMNAGNKPLRVIKEVRTLTSLGLKDAKELVDGAPKPVLAKVSLEAAATAKSSLEVYGASVKVIEYSNSTGQT